MGDNEQEVYADSAYAGKQIASLLGDKGRILHRPCCNKPLTDWQRQENIARQKHAMSSDTPFAHLKLHFDLTKAQRQARNHAFALFTAIAYNLKRAMPKIKLAL